jgi:hypothetical protein
MKYFTTMRQAAIAASAVAVPLTRQTGFEYGGLILKGPKGFSFTAPETSHSKGSLDPTLIYRKYVPDLPPIVRKPQQSAIVKKLRNAGVVSFYHVHPCDTGESDATYFSIDDMNTAVLLGHDAAYMAVACNGKVYEATKNTPPVFPDGPFFDPAAIGDLIGKV